ncbi:MAG: hypothetical protein Q7K45_00940 [Nanoarchaeota archaeon]|nr:hypothetical protein [Nanoarchaeota archaeon]
MKKNILIGILAVVIVGLGYFVLKNKPEISQINEQIPIQNIPLSSESTIQYQMIPEWGLRYEIADWNKDIYPKVQEHTAYNGIVYTALDLYSKKLQDQQQITEGGIQCPNY